MHAWVMEKFGEPDAMTWSELADPAPKADEVVIDVSAAGITFAELLVIRGKYQNLPTLPAVPGKEMAGTVRAVGANVARLKPGDRVLAFGSGGAYAEAAAVNEADCFALPAGVTPIDAAAMGMACQTAYFSLVDRGMLKRGDAVLVTGANGGVGLATIQVAKALGAIVYAAVRNKADAAPLIEAGASAVLDLSVADLKNALKEQLQAVAGKKGIDVFIDIVGGEAFEAGLRCMAWRGRCVTVGYMSGTIPNIKANYLLLKNISVAGMFFNTYKREARSEIVSAQEWLFDAYARGELRPKISATFPMKDLARAFGHLEAGGHIGRVLVTNEVA